MKIHIVPDQGSGLPDSIDCLNVKAIPRVGDVIELADCLDDEFNGQWPVTRVEHYYNLAGGELNSWMITVFVGPGE